MGLKFASWINKSFLDIREYCFKNNPSQTISLRRFHLETKELEIHKLCYKNILLQGKLDAEPWQILTFALKSA